MLSFRPMRTSPRFAYSVPKIGKGSFSPLGPDPRLLSGRAAFSHPRATRPSLCESFMGLFSDDRCAPPRCPKPSPYARCSLCTRTQYRQPPSERVPGRRRSWACRTAAARAFRQSGTHGSPQPGSGSCAVRYLLVSEYKHHTYGVLGVLRTQHFSGLKPFWNLWRQDRPPVSFR